MGIKCEFVKMKYNPFKREWRKVKCRRDATHFETGYRTTTKDALCEKHYKYETELNED